MTAPNLPSQLSESTFRIYEPHIRRALNNWFAPGFDTPQETQFTKEDMVDLNGRPLSPHTFAARMRDAMVSVKRFKWETDIPMDRLWSLSNLAVISYAPDGTVWFKAKGKRGRPSGLVQEARTQGFNIDAQVSTGTWTDVTEAELNALCLLITCERLVGPFFIQGKIAEDLVERLTEFHNVAIHFDPENNKTIIQ